MVESHTEFVRGGCQVPAAGPSVTATSRTRTRTSSSSVVSSLAITVAAKLLEPSKVSTSIRAGCGPVAERKTTPAPRS